MFTSIILCLFTVVFLAWSNPFSSYTEYLEKYNKSYTSPILYLRHFNTYIDKRNEMLSFNTANFTWKKGINRFSDLSETEFSKILNLNKKTHTKIVRAITYTSLPKSIDWRTENSVTNIKDQGLCGSCWPFSAIGSLEDAHSNKIGEQNLVDCAQIYGRDGCKGWWMNSVLKYVQYNHTVNTQVTYPYVSKDEEGEYKKQEKVVTTVENEVNITSEATYALLHAVSTVGPISVAIDATELQDYKSGIFSSTTCSSKFLNHGLLVVGYGVTTTEQKYYIIKSSWDTTWGMDGYVYWDRDIPNMCGIATRASYPVT